MLNENKIKVLIVDDSALVRKLLTSILGKDRSIEVVGTANDAYMAREKIKKLNPDVLTLDVEMPRMDGVTFLKNLMRLRPMPVIMISTLTEKSAEVTLDALAAGAIDFVTKPKVDLSHELESYAIEIISKVKSAATSRVCKYEGPIKKGCTPAIIMPESMLLKDGNDSYSTDEVFGEMAKRKHFATTDKLIAIGASTGGTEAIREVLDALPPTSPGVVIAQHIPPKFSAAFANRMDNSSALNVREAKDGETIIPGYAYVAPGDRHLQVVRDGVRWKCQLSDALPVNRHKPSVDVLFRSVAENAGPNATAVILTGMGKDGARGLKELREAGASTIAQDEASSVVWGMPGAAVGLDAAEEILPLNKVAAKLKSHFGC